MRDKVVDILQDSKGQHNKAASLDRGRVQKTPGTLRERSEAFTEKRLIRAISNTTSQLATTMQEEHNPLMTAVMRFDA